MPTNQCQPFEIGERYTRPLAHAHLTDALPPLGLKELGAQIADQKSI